MSGKTNKQIIFVLAVLLTTLGIHWNSYAATQPQVNLILDGKTVLIYHGEEAGYEKGQQLNVVRDGKVVGTVVVKEIARAYVQAEITSSPDNIREGDLITAGEGTKKASTKESKTTTEKPAASKRSSGKASGNEEKTKSGSTEKKTTAKTSSRSAGRRSRTSSKSDSSAKSDEKSGSSAKSSRSSRSRRSSKTSSSDDASSDSSAKSSRGGRGSRGGRSSKSSSDADKKETDKKEAAKQEEPKVLGATPHYSLHFGYFYINSGDLPGSVVSESPEPVVSLDYWVPKRKNMNLYYSIMYTRPKVQTVYNSQRVDYQLRMLQFMGGLVWDNLDSSLGRDFYGGFAAGWRNASYEINCSVSCDGLNDFQKKSMEGMDYHGILGATFKEKSEIKLLYSFDEQYYTIDYGIRY